MSSLDHYVKETAYLNEAQRKLYEIAEYAMMTHSQTPTGFENATVAIEALSVTMRKTINEFQGKMSH